MTTPEATVKKEMSLPELRKFEGQLFVMNNTPHKITFHESMGDKRVDFELDPAGEPDSLAFLPKLALDMRGLQKLWMRGAITISDDPDMENQIMLMNAAAVGASDDRMRTMLGLQTENDNTRDMTEAACLVCGRKSREGVIEQGRVLQSARQIKEGIPPLCSAHQNQSSLFVPRLVQDKGEQHWEFDSASLGDVQRENKVALP